MDIFFFLIWYHKSKKKTILKDKSTEKGIHNPRSIGGNIDHVCVCVYLRLGNQAQNDDKNFNFECNLPLASQCCINLYLPSTTDVVLVIQIRKRMHKPLVKNEFLCVW